MWKAFYGALELTLTALCCCWVGPFEAGYGSPFIAGAVPEAPVPELITWGRGLLPVSCDWFPWWFPWWIWDNGSWYWASGLLGGGDGDDMTHCSALGFAVIVSGTKPLLPLPKSDDTMWDKPWTLLRSSWSRKVGCWCKNRIMLHNQHSKHFTAVNLLASICQNDNIQGL